ncbi:MAG: hypothetical protein ACAI25_04285 [Planctomycetota bacterium]
MIDHDDFVYDALALEPERLEHVMFSILNLPLTTKHALGLIYPSLPAIQPVAVIAARVINGRTTSPVAVYSWTDCRSMSAANLLESAHHVPLNSLIVAGHGLAVLASGGVDTKAAVSDLLRSQRYIVFVDTPIAQELFEQHQNAREIHLVDVKAVTLPGGA